MAAGSFIAIVAVVAAAPVLGERTPIMLTRPFEGAFEPMKGRIHAMRALPSRVSCALLASAALAAPLACRGRADLVAPAPEVDASARRESPKAPSASACLRVSSCGVWRGCVLARHQPLPFTPPHGDRPVSAGEWFRFDLGDRRDEVGTRASVCVADAGGCYEGLQHLVACLPYFNPTAPDYRCELIDGTCARIASSAETW